MQPNDRAPAGYTEQPRSRRAGDCGAGKPDQLLDHRLERVAQPRVAALARAQAHKILDGGVYRRGHGLDRTS